MNRASGIDTLGHALRACALALLVALVGCAQELETDQARLCRMALPALWPPGTGFSILAEAEDADGRGVTIGYGSSQDTQRHTAHCRFRAPGRPRHSTELIEFSDDGQLLSAPRLFFLIRFWLATPEGRAADPAPLGRTDALPSLPAPAAYALQQTINALPAASIYALLAAAYALIYGLIGRVNLAFGALAAAGGYAAAFAAAQMQGAPPAPLLTAAGALAMAVGGAWSAAAGRAVFAPLKAATGQQTLVATVGLMVFLSELLRLTQGARPDWAAPVLNAPFGLARAGAFIVTASADALLAAALALVAASALTALLRFSRFGRNWRAFADDAFAAALFGVDPLRLTLASFGVAGALAGLAGFEMTMIYGAVGYDFAATLGLKALVAAILGGIDSPGGALVGGLLLGGFEAAWTATLAADYRDAAAYGLLAFLMALRPGGLFGTPPEVANSYRPRP